MNRKQTSQLMIGIGVAFIALQPFFMTAGANTQQDLQPQTSIPFVNFGGIRDWRAENDQTLLIEGVGGHWYRAKLMSPAIDLPFADRIGFVTEPSGSLDRFGTVVVRGRRYPIVSLTAAEPPAMRASPKVTI